MNIILTLDNQANTSVPIVNSHRSPKEYFMMGAEYLKMAGQYKKCGDMKNAYLHLKKYVM